jgi:hypothetical protein
VAPGAPSPEARSCPLPVGSGFPRARGPEELPCRWLGVSPLPVAPGAPQARGLRFPLRRVAQDCSKPEARNDPLPGGPGVAPCAGWRGVCSSPRARGCPRTGDSDRSLRRWLRGFPPVAGGSGFPLRRLPFPVVGKVLRLLARAAQGVSTSNFKILWPSTSHPQLTLSCPPRKAFLHRILHSAIHRPGLAEHWVAAGEPDQRVPGVADVRHAQHGRDDDQVIAGGQALRRLAFQRRESTVRD